MADTTLAEAALWEDAPAPQPAGMPDLHLPGFDGPMDLLLDLAERQRIDLGRISVLDLAEQFVAALARLERSVALERRADWLVMAARLLLLRSRLLFPGSPQSEADAAREAGAEARRLDRLLAVRAAAGWLDGQPQLGRDVFARPQGRSRRVTSYMALMEACLAMLLGPEGLPGADVGTYQPPPAALFRMEAAMDRIRALLAHGPQPVRFVHCLPVVRAADPQRALKARSAVASSLVAVLELTRLGEVGAAQADWDGAITLTAEAARPAT